MKAKFRFGVVSKYLLLTGNAGLDDEHKAIADRFLFQPRTSPAPETNDYFFLMSQRCNENRQKRNDRKYHGALITHRMAHKKSEDENFAQKTDQR